MDATVNRGQSNIEITLAAKVLDGAYKSDIENKGLSMPYDVGGLSKGTTVAELEGKSKDAIIDELLFPTVNPELINPSASIALKEYPEIVEVGSQAPSVASFVVGFDPGSIMMLDRKQNDRAGSLDVAQSYIYSGNAADKTMPAIIQEGNVMYRYRAVYAGGPQPKNNKGGDYGSPLASGSVDSPSVIVNGTFPWYASTSDSIVKQSLIAWNAQAGSMSTGNFTLLPSGIAAQVFKLPRQLSSLMQLNTISGKMDQVDMSDYTETTEKIVINGNVRTYYVYTYKGAARGSVTLLASF